MIPGENETASNKQKAEEDHKKHGTVGVGECVRISICYFSLHFRLLVVVLFLSFFCIYLCVPYAFRRMHAYCTCLFFFLDAMPCALCQYYLCYILADLIYVCAFIEYDFN